MNSCGCRHVAAAVLPLVDEAAALSFLKACQAGTPMASCKVGALLKPPTPPAAAMDKKARSRQMNHIVDRLLRYGEFEVVVFGDDTILNQPVEEWPRCDCLLSWHSGAWGGWGGGWGGWGGEAGRVAGVACCVQRAEVGMPA